MWFYWAGGKVCTSAHPKTPPVHVVELLRIFLAMWQTKCPAWASEQGDGFWLMVVYNSVIRVLSSQCEGATSLTTILQRFVVVLQSNTASFTPVPLILDLREGLLPHYKKQLTLTCFTYVYVVCVACLLPFKWHSLHYLMSGVTQCCYKLVSRAKHVGQGDFAVQEALKYM